MVPAHERRYLTAAGLSKDLLDRMHPPDAPALRLRGRVLERLAVLGDKDAQAGTIEAFRKARELDPKDVAGAEELARVYYGLVKDRAAADAVLDDLLRANPSATAYLAVSRFRGELAKDLAGDNRATEAEVEARASRDAIEKALKAAPNDLEVCCGAAEAALARKQPAEARALLARIPESKQADFRYRTLQGIVDLYENRADDAIESWSRGLRLAGGGDADLSWRLAYVLLQLGRVDEAEPLIGQFRRLVGGESPTPATRYLVGLKLMKQNRPVEALAELEKGRIQVPGALKAQYYYAMGQCREATRDEVKALDDYQVAQEADPRLAAPRLARARLLQAGRPEEAEAELRRGLAEAGDDPSLLAALARVELRKQVRLPVGRRSPGEVQALLERAKAAAPGSAGLALAQSEVMAASGRSEAAIDLLTEATKLNKNDLDLWLARVERLAQVGRIEEGLFVLDQASEPQAAGDHASLRILRARLLTNRGHGVQAREELVRDLDRIRPVERPQLWQALGELYSAQREPKNARKAFAEWCRLLPDDPLPWLLLLELAAPDPSDDAQALVRDARAALKRIGGVYRNIGEATLLLRDPATSPSGASPKEEDAKARTVRFQEAERLIDRIEAEAPSGGSAPCSGAPSGSAGANRRRPPRPMKRP